jgi:hypothetical protein
MPDRPSQAPPTSTDADLAITRLREMSTDLRGCAVLARDGDVLAASGDRERWGPAAADFLAAADSAAGQSASHVHVATEDGEVFAVREGGLAIVAVAERFILASLMLFDMRMVLRGFAATAGVPVAEMTGADGATAASGEGG